MKKNSVFQFKSYKSWLANLFSNPDNRGLMSRVCRQVDCQRSYLSRVLSGKLQLTPDYAYKISEALHMSGLEQEYFLLLVDLDRCNDSNHRNFINNKLKKMLAQHSEVGEKVQRPSPQQSFDQTQYFSNWYWSAIHMWCSTTGHHTVESVSKKFSLEPALVQKCLETLIQIGFLELQAGSYQYKMGAMHLDRNSPYTLWNHSNWRQKALQNAQLQKDSSLHFTNLQTMTRSDFQRIRTLILEIIEKMEGIARPSAPEELALVCLDVFLVD